MKVLLHELRSHLKGQIGWVLALVLFMVLSVAKFDALATDKAASETLLRQLPATMQAVFGMTGLDISTLSGYFGVLFVYLLLILSLHAGMLGAGVLSEEEQDRTTEFLFVKPRQRTNIITAKLVAALIYVILMWLVVVVSTYAAVQHIPERSTFMADFVAFMLALGVVQGTMYCIGAFAAAITSNPRWPSRIVVVLVFGWYLIFTLVKLVPNFDILKFFSPFCYFDAADIIAKSAANTGYVILCGAACVVATIGTYVFYNRRDLRV